MHRAGIIAFFCLAAAAAAPATPRGRAFPQRVVDRIIVRIEDDIITSSEMQELAAYQQLLDGQAQPQDRLLAELIEQWVVNGEATAARFPPAADSEVQREVARIRSRFASQQAYEQRLAELELTPDTVRNIVARQIFLARYLDYKFRPAVQIGDDAIEKYYQQEFVPALAAKNQKAPPLDDVRDQIREVLVQQGINERASTWIEETKSRLNIEVEPPASASSTQPRTSVAP